MYQTFTTRCCTSQRTELSDTKCVMTASQCWDSPDVTDVRTLRPKRLYKAVQQTLLSYSTELCNDHRHDAVEFFIVYETSTTDTVQKRWLYGATSYANISAVAARHSKRPPVYFIKTVTMPLSFPIFLELSEISSRNLGGRHLCGVLSSLWG